MAASIHRGNALQSRGRAFQSKGRAFQSSGHTLQSRGHTLQSRGRGIPIQGTGVSIQGTGISIQRTSASIQGTGASIQGSGSSIYTVAITSELIVPLRLRLRLRPLVPQEIVKKSLHLVYQIVQTLNKMTGKPGNGITSRSKRNECPLN